MKLKNLVKKIQKHFDKTEEVTVKDIAEIVLENTN